MRFDFQNYVKRREANPNTPNIRLQNYAFIGDIEHQRELAESAPVQQAVTLGLQAWQLAKGRKIKKNAREVDADLARISSLWAEVCYQFGHNAIPIKIIPMQAEFFTPYSGRDAFFFGLSPKACIFSSNVLKFLFGTGIGALDNGHAPYLTLGRFFDDLTHGLWGKATGIPDVLIQWREAALITQDRAGMMACRDISAAMLAIMKASLDWDNSEIMREIRRYHDGLDVDWGTVSVEKRIRSIEAFMQSDIYNRIGGIPIEGVDARVRDLYKMIL